MSNEAYYLRVRTAIHALTEEQIHEPRIPIDRYLQESENLYQWAQKDRAQLEAVGLDWNRVDEIPVRVGALRHAEAKWFESRFARQAARKAWSDAVKPAYRLRDKLLRDFRYALRQDKSQLKRVADITQGRGHADMIQDLQNLAVFGQANIEALIQIRFDPKQLDEAAKQASRLAELLAKATEERLSSREWHALRNRTHSYLKQAIDELRQCGQYVFWNNEERRRAYYCQYYRKIRKRRHLTNPHESDTSNKPKTQPDNLTDRLTDNLTDSLSGDAQSESF